MNKIAVLFPGQGSQYVGMGKEFYENFSIVKEVFEEANDILGFDLKQLCFEGDLDELTKTENAQPAILTLSVAIFKAYMKEIGINPIYCAGHSLGEYSALTCSGAINFADAVQIVNKRGKFMQETIANGVGAMVAISEIDMEFVEKECKYQSLDGNIVNISNYNSTDQFVISGHKDAVDKLIIKLKEKNAQIVPLNVSAPFHSPLMQPAADRLKKELEKYKYSNLDFDVISNVTVLPYKSKDNIVDNLYMQMIKPVRWKDTIEFLYKQGIEMAIEIGPKTILQNLMRKNTANIKTFSYDKADDVKELTKILKNPTIAKVNNKSPKILFITRCLSIAACTKNRNWNNDAYHRGVVGPCRKVKAMLDELEQKSIEPNIDQMKEALTMLESVFETKGCPKDEQQQRYNQIVNETGLHYIFK